MSTTRDEATGDAWRPAYAVLGALLGAAAALLPFWGIGGVNVQDDLALKPIDLCLLLASPLALAAMVRQRALLLRSGLFWSVLALAASAAASSLLFDDRAWQARAIGRQLLLVVAVGGTACAAADDARKRRIRLGFLAGGVAAIAVSLVGWAIMVFAVGAGEGIHPFVFAGAHPLFDLWPRLSGTFGHSPQYFGEYLAALLAIAAAAWGGGTRAERRLARIAVLGGGAALALTFSYAWIAALTLAVGLFFGLTGRSRAVRAGVLGLGLAAALACQAILHLGAPSSLAPDDARAGVPCADLDGWHDVSVELDDAGLRCRPWVVSRPYRALMTTYLHAKLVALAVIRGNPWLGVGQSRYEARAREVIAGQLGPFRAGSFYLTPHCEYLGAWAIRGVPGALALLFFAAAVIRARPRAGGGAGRRTRNPERLALWLGVVGFLILGISVDVLDNRAVWFLVGFLVREEIGAGITPPPPSAGASSPR